MRILFLGTSEFAVPVLRGVAGTDHDLALVVTAPDRPKGRGRKVEPTPVGAAAKELGLECYQPVKINDPAAVARLEALAPDLVVVVAYGQILREPILNLAPRGIVNLHGSVLPHLRGAAPIARGIQRGDTTGGVTLQHVVRAVDAGDVIASRTVAFDDDETAGEATTRLSWIARDLLLDNLDGLQRGGAPRMPQDPSGVTHAPPIEKREGRVPWHLPADAVRNHVRAMTPWPSAHTEFAYDGRSERLILREVERSGLGGDGPPDVPPGTVRRPGGEMVVACGDGWVVIRRLMRSGKAEMDTAAFLRGNDIPEGTLLG